MLILLDIHRNILSAQGFFKCTTDCISNVDIILEPSKLRLSFIKDSSSHYLNITMPDKFLLPSTISSVCCNSPSGYSVKHDKNIAKLSFPLLYDSESSSKRKAHMLEVRFRLQVSNNSALENCVLKSLSGKDFKNFIYEKLKQIQLFSIICTECGTSITEKSISFQFVSKYYEGMSEMAESWFCHKHNHDSSEINANSLYVGDTYFFFHDSTIKLFNISESNKEFKCTRCSSILSLKKRMDIPHYIGFFCDKIMLIESETESEKIKNYKLDYALFSFCSIIQELLKSAVSCKMYLQCKVGETTDILLLWVNSQTVVQFLLQATNDEMPCEKDFKGTEVYKVLYSICSSDSELSKKWKHDFSVEFYQISDNMMNVVKGLLQESSKYFPDEQKVKGFSFGYLPAYVSIQ